MEYGNKGGHCTTKESSFVGHMVMVVWGEEKSAMEMDYLFDMWQRVETLDNKRRQNNYLSKKKKKEQLWFSSMEECQDWLGEICEQCSIHD